jgi:hypothetical protein
MRLVGKFIENGRGTLTKLEYLIRPVNSFIRPVHAYRFLVPLPASNHQDLVER